MIRFWKNLRFRIASMAESFRWAAPVEYYKESEKVPGAKLYKVRAIHCTTTANKNRYTAEELRLGARSLAERPLNINHQIYDLPKENKVLDAEYESGAVECVIQVADPTLQEMIKEGKIVHVSIEAKYRAAEQGDALVPRGIVFTGLGLLTKEVPPGDSLSNIVLWEKKSIVESLSPDQKHAYLAAVNEELKRRNALSQ